MVFFKSFFHIYLFIFFCFFFGKNSFALDSLSYSGRLVQTNGAPVSGTVILRAELAYTPGLAPILCTDDIPGVVLSKGVFHVKLEFTCTGKTLTEVLSQVPAGESVAIRITDMTNSKAYSFQAIHAMPLANVASQLVQMGAGDGEFLKWDDTAKKWKPGIVSGASGGTVTSVAASGPLSVTNPTSTPSISISQANTTTSGYLSSADWNSFNSKEGTIVGGTATQYYRGDKTWQTLDTAAVPENLNLYFTNARVLGVPLAGFATSTSAIVATDSTLEAFGKAQGQINAINTASSNYLIKNSTDSVTGVVNVGTTGLLQLVYTPVGLNDATNKAYVDSEVGNKVSKTGDTVSGVLTLDNDLKIKGGSNHVTVKGHASSANYNLTLPQSAGTAGYVLSTDGSGNTNWVTPAVGSSNITDGSIVDADVNASAAIAQSKIANLTSDLAGKEPSIAAGTAAQYWKGNKTWASLQTDVQALVLNGFATGSNSSLVNTDTVSGAFGKVQGQIDAINTSIAGKEASLAAGTSAQFYRGDKSWQTLNGGAVANTPAGAIAATTTQNAINELDSEKQDKLTATSVVDNRELRFYELTGNGSFYSSLKSPDDLTGNINYTLPLVAPTAGQVLSSNASGVMSWISIPSAPVTTVFGRSGTVAATAGDYTASQITNTAAGSIAATTVQAALNELDSEKQSNITSGTTAQYYRGDKTWATFATDAINSVLSTFTVGTGTKPAVTNTDTVVGAFGKVQKTLNDINADYVSKTANQTINGSLAINSVTGFITVPTPINPTDAANKAYVDGFGQWIKGSGANSGDIYRSSGNVGIGTNSPQSNIHIVQNSDSISGGLRVSNISLGASTSLFVDGSNRTHLGGSTASPNAIVIDNSSGFVGFNTSAPLSSLDLSTRTDALALPNGTTAQQPSSPVAGMLRFNTTTSNLEVYNGSTWVISVAGGSTVNPAGLVSPFSRSTCPAGWIEANGATISRTTYSSLFAAIGTTFGAGDGSTTFKIPDLRGEFIRGFDNGRGVDASRAFGSFQKGTLGVGDDGNGVNSVSFPSTFAATAQADPIVPADYPSIAASSSTAENPNIYTTASASAYYGVMRPRNVAMVYCVSTATAPLTTIASTGSGTTNKVPVWTSSTALGDSPVSVSGSNVGIGTASPTTALEVNGTVKATNFSGTINGLKLASGTFTYSVNSCNSVASPCAVNISSGNFSSAPNCTITMSVIDTTSYTEKMVIKNTTSTTLYIWKGNYPDAGTTMVGTWICIGT